MFEEMARAYQAKLYYLVIAVALTIPDICAGAEFTDPKRYVKKDDYVGWCDRYITSLKPGHEKKILDGADVFHLRGGLIHRGDFKHQDRKFDHVAFTLADSANRLHCVVSADADRRILYLDVQQFVSDMHASVVKWLDDATDQPHVLANVERIVAPRELTASVGPLRISKLLVYSGGA